MATTPAIAVAEFFGEVFGLDLASGKSSITNWLPGSRRFNSGSSGSRSMPRQKRRSELDETKG